MQLKDGSKPTVLGWRFRGLLDGAVGLCSVRLWRGLRGPSAETAELGFFCSMFSYCEEWSCRKP